MAIELKKNVYWVGYVDWTVRDFHGYTTKRGATYNAYLVRDESSALIDTVKGPYAENLLARIAEIMDPAEITYVVCNHAEPDHSSGLPAVMQALPGATVVCNEKCRAALAEHYDTEAWTFHVVASGDTLSLGNRTLTFIDTPMVHWPESMFTYCVEDTLLFSMDAFGQHYASALRFDDENPLCTIMEEARVYYANIVTPYSRRVRETLDAASGLEISMIAPSHGIVWRSHIDAILAAYRNWSACRSKPKVLVLYDTMWESTARLAEALVQGASLPGVDVKLLNIRQSDLTTVATELLDSAAVAVGSSTLNRDMLPMMAATLSYVKGLNFTDRDALAFGSFGWSKGGPEAVHKVLGEMKWNLLQDPIRSKFRPDAACLETCREAGQRLAELALKRAAESGYETLCTD